MGAKPTVPLPPFLPLHNLTLKCAVSGTGGVGKSALCRRACQNVFIGDYYYDCSIEESFRKHVSFDGGTTVVEFVDLAGQEEFMVLYDQIYRDADIILLCFSIDSLISFQELGRYVQQIRRVKDDEFIPIILVGCKSDLHAARQVSAHQARLFEVEINAWSYIETSSRIGVNIEELLLEIARACGCSTPHQHLDHKVKTCQKELQAAYDITQKSIALLQQLVSVDCANLCLAYAALSMPSPPPPLNKHSGKQLAHSDQKYYHDMVVRLQERAKREREAMEEAAKRSPSERIRCVDGEGFVSVFGKSTKTKVKDLKVGDRVATRCPGEFATITRVFKDLVPKPRPLVCLDGVKMTRCHPVYQESTEEWVHATEIGELCMSPSTEFYLFNFELDTHHSMRVNSLVVATLGCDVGERLRLLRPDLESRFGLGWWSARDIIERD